MRILINLNLTNYYVSLLITNILNENLPKFNFLARYWYLNEIIWQEGLLVDFLQKKICDNWIKKFLIYSAYLFNERLIFDKLIKFMLDLVIIPLHKFSFFDVNNVSMMFYYIFVLFFLIFYVLFFFIVFFLMF